MSSTKPSSYPRDKTIMVSMSRWNTEVNPSRSAHSAIRHAKEVGITIEEMEHVVLLSITTLGLPAAGRAMAWIDDPAD